ncbi:MAG: hypothetical protein R3C99_26765 [Pirellulaceae bacterium]
MTTWPVFAIGVRSEYTDGRYASAVDSVGRIFEGPYYETWPPVTHRNLFIDSSEPSESPAYATEIVRTSPSGLFGVD